MNIDDKLDLQNNEISSKSELTNKSDEATTKTDISTITNFEVTTISDEATTKTDSLREWTAKPGLRRLPVRLVKGASNASIRAVVLCYWDNIYGPKVRKIWSVDCSQEKDHTRILEGGGRGEGEVGEDEERERGGLDWETLNFIARHSLCSEIMKDARSAHLDSKFFHSTHKKFVMSVLSFGAMSQMDLSMHSLCVVAAYEHVDHFMVWQDVVAEWLEVCVLQLKVALAADAGIAVEVVGQSVEEMVHLMQSPCVLNDNVPHTTVWERSHNNSDNSDNSGNSNNISNDNTDNSDWMQFIHKSVVGHYCQAQHSIVIGTDPVLVNKMVYTLSQLSLPQKTHRHHPLTSPSQTYSPYLHIQGLFKSAQTTEKILSTCRLSRRPSCLIDVDALEVMMMCWLEEYEAVQRSFLASKLLLLWNDTSLPPCTLREIFKGVDVKMSLLLPPLQDINRFPGHLATALSNHLLKLLQRKALLLVHYVTTALAKVESNSKLSSVPESYDELLSCIRKDLGLHVEWDLRLLCAFSESMQPGFLHSLTHFPFASR